MFPNCHQTVAESVIVLCGLFGAKFLEIRPIELVLKLIFLSKCYQLDRIVLKMVKLSLIHVANLQVNRSV